jgi:uncharacterized repeat protein (TIGR03847 family)
MVYLNSEDPDGFAAGAIGAPGQRVFYLQVRAEGWTVNVRCEKQQVAELARHLRVMLDDLPEPDADDGGAARLLEPVTEDFILGSIGLGLDRAAARMIVQLEEMAVIDEDDIEELAGLAGDDLDLDMDTSSVRVLITPGQARAFCDAAERAVSAGRGTCRWCGGPIDPSGHACPRFN